MANITSSKALNAAAAAASYMQAHRAEQPAAAAVTTFILPAASSQTCYTAVVIFLPTAARLSYCCYSHPSLLCIPQATAKKPEHVRIFHSQDIAGIVAKDVRISPEDLGAEQYDFGFETDAAISRGRGG